MGHFYFTRHGQTVWNVENKICGATDIELTELGHEQAMELGRTIFWCFLSRFYCFNDWASPLGRKRASL